MDVDVDDIRRIDGAVVVLVVVADNVAEVHKVAASLVLYRTVPEVALLVRTVVC